MIELRTLGELAVKVGGEPRRLATDKQSALLVYLACHQGRAQRREHLAGLLWEGSPQKRARQSLSQALYEIRQRLPELPLDVSREEIRVEAGSFLVDAQLFRAMVEAHRLPEAAALYEGDFLDGFWVSGARTFEEWQLAERDELSRLAKHVLHRLLRDAEAGGDWLQVDRYAARLLRLDPYDEAVYRARLQAIAANEGRRPALTEYRRLEDFIRAELGRELEPATRVLGARFEADASRSGPLPEDAQGEGHWTQFIGRQEEFARLRATWEAVRSGMRRAVVISGEPGIGKTRLAEQFLRLCAIQGGRIFQGRCYATDRHIPYSGIISALLGSIRDDDLVLLPSEWATVLAEILPELHTLAPDIQRAAPLAGEGARRRLFEGFAQLFQHLSAASPVVLHLDDFQWCDVSSAALLHYLVRRLAEAPVLILLGMRPEGEASHMPPELLAVGEGASQGFGRVNLEPLPYDEVERIVQSFAERQVVQVPGDAAREIYARAGGRPFFIIELLRAMVQGSMEWGEEGQVDQRPGRRRIVLPPSVEEFLQGSMRGLSGDAEPVLASLAVLGTRADPVVLAEVAGMAAGQLVRGVGELRARGLVHESESEISFPHDLIRETAYRALGRSRRRVLHGAAAEALQRRKETPPAVLCTHFDSAGMQEPAYRHALAAADESARVYGHEETEYFLRIALANASSIVDQANVKERLAALLISLSRYTEAEQLLLDIGSIAEIDSDPCRSLAIRSMLVTTALKQGGYSQDRLIDDIVHLVDQAEVNECYAIQVDLLKNLVTIGHFVGRRDIVQSVLDRTSQVADLVPDIRSKVTSLTFAANSICIYRGAAASLPIAEIAVQRAVESKDDYSMAEAYTCRGINRMHAGMLSAAEQDFLMALDLLRRFAAASIQQFAMNSYGALLVDRGDYDDARRVLSDAIEQAAAAAAFPDQLLATGNLLLVEHECGNVAAAEALAHEVLALSQKAPFLWATIGAWSILGTYALERGDLETAREYRDEIMAYAAGRDFWGSDASYTEIFFARLRVAEGDEEGALARLGEAVDAYVDRDFFCRSRLQLERARLLLARDPAAAGREAAEVRARGKESGARPLITRADAILDRVQRLAPR